METFSALLALCAGNSPVPVNSPHKGQWRGVLMFSLICDLINGWVHNREAGDLRRHRGHYDVMVMISIKTMPVYSQIHNLQNGKHFTPPVSNTLTLYDGTLSIHTAVLLNMHAFVMTSLWSFANLESIVSDDMYMDIWLWKWKQLLANHWDHDLTIVFLSICALSALFINKPPLLINHAQKTIRTKNKNTWVYEMKTLRPESNDWYFVDVIFKCIDFNGNLCIFDKLSLNVIHKNERRAITWTTTFTTHVCVTRPRWLNTLRPRQNDGHF